MRGASPSPKLCNAVLTQLKVFLKPFKGLILRILIRGLAFHSPHGLFFAIQLWQASVGAAASEGKYRENSL